MLGRERGDTIIEVVIAVTMFSMAAIVGFALMNHGLIIAQRTLELTLVRQQIDMQADALRFLNNDYITNHSKDVDSTKRWHKLMTEQAVDRATDYDTIADFSGCNVPSHAFALDLNQLDTNSERVGVLTVDPEPATYAKVRLDDRGQATSEGLWIEAVRAPKTRVAKGYYDFHIRACWHSPGSQLPMTVGTIVRLYVPEVF